MLYCKPDKRRYRPTSKYIFILVLLGLLAVGAYATLRARMVQVSRIWSQQTQASDGRQVAYVDEHLCAGCHGQAVAAWQNSHHAQAMQPATDATVLGDFNNKSFADAGITARFFKKDGKFFVDTPTGNGQPTTFAVKYTFGVEPLQQYLLVFPNGRLQAFTVAWDVAKRRWFNLYSNEKIKPTDPLHWTQRHFTWNSACAECHSTHLQLNYAVKTDQYQTSWAAINVGCQACHGPGANHVAWAQKKDGQTQSLAHKGLVVDYQQPTAQQTARNVVESCAPCHARRYPLTADKQTGQPWLDHFMPELLQPGLYYPDGQIQDEVFEYGSFVQSKMYQRGVGCTDCHNPHTLALRRQGNALCTACHQPNPPTARFPALAAKSYDTPAHHFHKPDSPGAQCVNCHMPSKTYMVVDPRRDHSIRLPRPDLSQQLGTPNACTNCHTAKDAAWAVAALTQWYGPQWQARPHFAATLAAGRQGAPEAMPALGALAQDANQPVIARATALDLLRAYGDAGAPPLLAALTDTEPLIRAAAARSLTDLSTSQKQASLTPLLQDPIRAVRIAAARALVNTAPAPTLGAALDEYKAAQLAVADQPEGHANLGALYSSLGQWAPAEQAYKAALARDAHFFSAYTSLAQLYVQTERPAEAEQILQQGLTVLPEQGELYYTLGLLLVGQQRLPEAAAALSKATVLLSNQPRVYYNYGLLLQKLGQLADAEAALRRAVDLDPQAFDALYALAVFYVKQGQAPNARPYLERLKQLDPASPKVQQLTKILQP